METKNIQLIKKIKKLSFEEKIALLFEILNSIKEERRKKMKVDIMKYGGLLKNKKFDSLVYQQKVRNEWRKRGSS